MRSLSRQSVTPIGVDIGSRAVKALQLVRDRLGYRVSAAAEYPREKPGEPWGAAESERLCGLLSRQGFRGNRVVLAAPSAQLAVEVLDLPPRSSGAPIDEIARAEMARVRKYEPGSFEMTSWDLPAAARSGAVTSVLAVAIRSDDATAYLDLFETRGLDVVALDTGSWALARAACLAARRRTGTMAVLDIGWTGATLVLIQNERVVYQRSLAGADLGSLVSDLTRSVGLPADAVEELLACDELPTEGDASLMQARDAKPVFHRYFETLATELQVSISYASHRFPESPVGELLITGGGAGIEGLCSHLSDRLAVAATALAPGDLIELPQAFATRCSHGRMTLALGLALHEEQ